MLNALIPKRCLERMRVKLLSGKTQNSTLKLRKICVFCACSRRVACLFLVCISRGVVVFHSSSCRARTAPHYFYCYLLALVYYLHCVGPREKAKFLRLHS